MKSQYPDHGGFETHRGGSGGAIADTMTLLSSSISLETAICIAYLLALVHTAAQCVNLVRWAIGKPTVVVRVKKAN